LSKIHLTSLGNIHLGSKSKVVQINAF